MEMKYCTIVKDDIFRMLRIMDSLNFIFAKPYFLKSTVANVYMVKNSTEAISDNTAAMAAPSIPISGQPKFPNIRA